MKYRIPALLVVAALALAAPLPTTSAPPPRDAQDEGAQTRGAFFATRPVAQNARPKKPVQKTRPGGTAKANPTPRPRPTPREGNENAGATHTSTGATETAAATTPPGTTPIGLGYTLFLCGENRTAVRVDPARKFRTGEAVRVRLETNTDGYLYIFNDDGAAVQMLYPHGRLGGENAISAHVPHQIPSTGDDCFRFTDNSRGVERLYVVVAREPLAGVPDAAGLVKYCAERKDACEWEAAQDVWARIQTDAKVPTLLSKSDELLGQSLSSGEREAGTRGLTLSRHDPAPAIIRMNASPSAKVFVTSIDLVRD